LPLNVVARLQNIGDPDATSRLTRDRHRALSREKRNAPVIGPSPEMSAGPHIPDGFALTLWEHVEQVAADRDDAEHVSPAAKALCRLHLRWSGFPASCLTLAQGQPLWRHA